MKLTIIFLIIWAALICEAIDNSPPQFASEELHNQLDTNLENIQSRDDLPVQRYRRGKIKKMLGAAAGIGGGLLAYKAAKKGVKHWRKQNRYREYDDGRGYGQGGRNRYNEDDYGNGGGGRGRCDDENANCAYMVGRCRDTSVSAMCMRTCGSC
ncbi:hypothetical protein GJ496_004040 [Pomphorhynchus laevis]|nr:hypothetical protein GJ496_004040 [Pomphorhynchus laevis]